MNLVGFDHPKVWKKTMHCFRSPSLKVHNKETRWDLRFSEIGEQRANSFNFKDT